MGALFPSFQTIRCNNRILHLGVPQVMGILNVTPDSFFLQSRVDSVEMALKQVSNMVSDGATILDIGGHSTRPDAQKVTVSEEIDRILPIVEAISSHFPDLVLSIDTYRLKVAQEAFKVGAHIFNDIGGGNMDDGIFDWICENQVPYILTHSVGSFQEVHQVPQYTNFLQDVISNLLEKVQFLRNKGLKDLMVDPGFGFSKSLDQNYEMLAQLDQYTLLGAPILVGVSRKSMISKLLGVNSTETLNASTALHMTALMKGAKILRVHDVKEAFEVIQIHQKLTENGLSNL